MNNNLLLGFALIAASTAVVTATQQQQRPAVYVGVAEDDGRIEPPYGKVEDWNIVVFPTVIGHDEVPGNDVALNDNSHVLARFGVRVDGSGWRVFSKSLDHLNNKNEYATNAKPLQYVLAHR